MDYKKHSVHNGYMKTLTLTITGLAIIMGCGGCGSKEEQKTEKSAPVEYAQTLSTAPDTARRVVGTVEDKGASYGEEVPE